MKVDFVNDYIYRYGSFYYHQGKRLDNILNILTDKICAIVSRDEPKDVADFFTIALNEDFIWDEVIGIAKKRKF